MAITRSFAVGANANGTAAASITTGTFDSTGFTHIVAFSKHEGSSATITPSDNKGSTGWASLTKQANGVSDSWGQFHWVKIGTPGTGHTVTTSYSSNRTFRAAIVWLVNATSGEIALDVGTDVTANGSSTTPDAGSITTSAAAVIFNGVAEYSAVLYTPGTGWTEDYEPAGNPGTFSYGQSRQEASAGTFNPACTTDGSQDWASCACAFIEVVAGGDPVGKLIQGKLMRGGILINGVLV